MQPLTRGLFTARLISGEDDLTEAQALRHLAFRPGLGLGLDQDDHDALCRHLLVREGAGALVACCRLQAFEDGTSLAASYSAQFYDLARLSAFPGARMELGRFCLHPAWHDPDILRLIWAMLTAIVDAERVTLLFGCSSFPGADPARHLAALAALRDFVAPPDLAPGPRARLRVDLPPGGGDPSGLPALLRTYLAMGGWVSDHAVIDHDMDTLHVLTGLETARVSPARARALRAIVQPA
ncbi:GNAT family N-acetyltransferase [bacterium]|nr:GNAT family N-acetyltransferase [bacterium]